jgi:hypothetical protein
LVFFSFLSYSSSAASQSQKKRLLAKAQSECLVSIAPTPSQPTAPVQVPKREAHVFQEPRTPNVVGYADDVRSVGVGEGPWGHLSRPSTSNAAQPISKREDRYHESGRSNRYEQDAFGREHERDVG